MTLNKQEVNCKAKIKIVATINNKLENCVKNVINYNRI